MGKRTDVWTEPAAHSHVTYNCTAAHTHNSRATTNDACQRVTRIKSVTSEVRTTSFDLPEINGDIFGTKAQGRSSKLQRQATRVNTFAHTPDMSPGARHSQLDRRVRVAEGTQVPGGQCNANGKGFVKDKASGVDRLQGRRSHAART